MYEGVGLGAEVSLLEEEVLTLDIVYYIFELFDIKWGVLLFGYMEIFYAPPKRFASLLMGIPLL